MTMVKTILKSAAVLAVLGASQAAANPASFTGEVFELNKKPAMVQMKNVKTGEVGCHNNQTQTSTPGPCPWPRH